MKCIVINSLLTLTLSVTSSLSWADDIAVIVHPQAGFDEITTGETRQLFMGKSKTLPNTQTARLLMHEENSPLRVGFDRAVLDRDPKQMRAYWAQMIFTGRGMPPRQLENDEAIKQEVAAHPNAIGYIDGKSVDATVKVVLMITTAP